MSKLLKYSLAKYNVLQQIKEKCLKVGDPLPSQREFLESGAFGMQTLRRALEELEEENIIERSQGKVARLKKEFRHISAHSKILFIKIYQHHPSPDIDFYKFQTYLGEHGVDVVYQAYNSPDVDLSEVCKECHIIVVSGWIDESWLEYLRVYHLPIFAIGSHPMSDVIPTVSSNWKHAMQLMTRHLKNDFKCRKIALMLGSRAYQPVSELSEAFLAEDGASENLLWCSQEMISRWKHYDVQPMIHFLKSLHDCDALIVDGDLLLDTVALAMREVNVPGTIRFAVINQLSRYTRNSFHHISLVSFPESLYLKAADIILRTLTCGYDELKSAVIEPVLWNSQN